MACKYLKKTLVHGEKGIEKEKIEEKKACPIKVHGITARRELKITPELSKCFHFTLDVISIGIMEIKA